MANSLRYKQASRGRGVQFAVDEKAGKLHLMVDISDKALEDAPPSSTGKTKTVATTSGFVWDAGKFGISLNVNMKANA